MIRKFIIILSAAVVFAQPTTDKLLAIEKKRAEYFRLRLLQLQVALEIQNLQATIPAEVKAAGCTIDERLEVMQCKEDAKK